MELIELSSAEIDAVSGGFSISWSHQPTNWGEVAAWTGGGAIAGALGGWRGVALGALGGGGADYVSQHLKIYLK